MTIDKHENKQASPFIAIPADLKGHGCYSLDGTVCVALRSEGICLSLGACNKNTAGVDGGPSIIWVRNPVLTTNKV